MMPKSQSETKSIEIKPTRQELNAREFLRKQRLARQREEAEKRFPFTPEFSENANSEQLLKTAKRIRHAEESDNQSFVFSSDLTAAVHALMLCAGHALDPDLPLDIQFLAAMQKVSDWDLGRTLPTDMEWSRVGALNYIWEQVVRTLDAIDELHKANRRGFEPSEKWFKSYRTVSRAA